MIKGVNRNIIEVYSPDSIYFEKAVFYLKPQIRQLPPELARAAAERYLDGTGTDLRRQSRSVRIGRRLIWLALLLTAAAIVLALSIGNVV